MGVVVVLAEKVTFSSRDSELWPTISPQ